MTGPRGTYNAAGSPPVPQPPSSARGHRSRNGAYDWPVAGLLSGLRLVAAHAAARAGLAYWHTVLTHRDR
ncbi:hypothetical protein AB0K92_29290 [Streptomyces sp. NPDC052687]|uniref:hypothetical protein n=1 Tax=Streptomyces sp. NPDC052687 TaxID=3154759 RepID=UPI00344795B4